MASNNLDFLLNLRANTSGFDQGINGAKFAVNALVGAMAALGVGLGVKELAEAADSYAMLSAKIQQSTKESGNFQQAIAGVHQIALNTNSSLDATAGLFAKLNTVAKDMGQTQQYALDMTSTVTKAIQLGGGSAQASEAAVQQFIQAMQGGVLRGEEFNSIMENGYGLAEALAKGLGVTTGELRKMAEAGELSAERVLGALAKQKEGVDAQYAELPLTISNALQKIATSWQILIGEMDQANGASASVAQWLSTLADNMKLLKPIIDDIGSGFTRFGSYLTDIYDQGAIDSLKSALGSIYETIKTLFNTVLDVGRAFNDVFDDALSEVLSFTDGLRPAGVEVSGLQKVFDSLKIAISLIGDGFKAVGVITNLFTGTLYRLAAVWYEVKATFTWGKVKEEAIANMTAMQNKSDEYFTKGFDGIKNYESQTIKSIENIGKTEQQKNAERIANNAKALSDLKAQESKHVADYKTISDERIKLHQQLVDARKSGDQAVIDAAVVGLAELNKKEKNYQAESKRISDEKIKAAQEWVNFQLKATDGTIKAADAATQKTLQTALAAQGLAIEFDKAGKAIVKAMEESSNAVKSLDSRLAEGRKGAVSLGIDIDVALNRVSEGFKEKGRAFENFTKNLELMGATGKRAADLTYEAWRKWLETAKSQAEIDAAKAKLDEFEKKGIFSTKQVEMGMLAIKQVTAKLPDDLDEVGKAFDRLGIKTKEQLQLAAQSAIADFNTIKASGQATSEGLKQAYERVMQAAAASGDQAVIANAKAQGASVGLQAQIDETGKSSVKSTQEIVDALYDVEKTARGSTADGFRELGRVAREEAKSTADEWLDAMAKVDADRKAKAAETAKGLGQLADGQNQMAQNFYDQLIAGGMEKGRAEELKNEAITRMINQLRTALNGGSVSGAYDAKIGRNESQAWMQEILDGLDSKGSIGTSSPKISAPNIEAPSIQQFKMPNIETGPSKTVTYRFEFGGQELEFQGDPSQQDMVNSFFNQLEQAKKRM